jgi:hypothetical protein
MIIEIAFIQILSINRKKSSKNPKDFLKKSSRNVAWVVFKIQLIGKKFFGL